jgi:diguanylate cyclase (GGDEF)-like protein
VIPVSLIILPLVIYAAEITSRNVTIILTGAVEVVLVAGAILFSEQLYGYLIAMVVIGAWTFFPVGTLKQHQKKLKDLLDDRDKLKQAYEALTRRNKPVEKELTLLNSELARLVSIYGTTAGILDCLYIEDIVKLVEDCLIKHFGIKSYMMFIFKQSGSPMIASAGAAEFFDDTSMELLKRAVIKGEIPDQLQDGEYLLQIPIVTKNMRTGLILGLLKEKPTSTWQREAVLFGQQFSLGLRKTLLYEDVLGKSRIDTLTGLFVRREFLKRLSAELLRAKRYKYPVCIAMLDLDHFKRINDRWGHPAGDKVLAMVGYVLKDNLYETDFVGRWGGEEFLLAMPHADVEGALKKAEKIRLAIAKEQVKFDGDVTNITVSIGFTCTARGVTDEHKLIEIADHALYQAKKSGRNRIINISA